MMTMPESPAAPRRAGQLAGLAAGLTLLAAAGCSSSGSPVTSTSRKPQASAAVPSSPAAPGGTAAAPAGTFGFPGKIGNLSKQFDDPGVGAARGGGIPKAVLKNLRSVTYGDDSQPTSAGGTAECTTDSAFKNGLDCGWVTGTIALTISFNGIPLARARVLMPQILSAMVSG
jgi:hypothetical protein